MSYVQHSIQDVREALSGERVSWLTVDEHRGRGSHPCRWDKSPARCIRSGDYWLYMQLQPDVSKLDAIDSTVTRGDPRPWLTRLQALRARGLDAAALRSAGPPSLPHARVRELRAKGASQEPLLPHQESKWSLGAGISDPEVQEAEMSQRISDTLLDLEEQLRRRPHLPAASSDEDEHGLEVDFTETCKLDSQNYREFQTNMSCGAFKVLSNAVKKACRNKKQ
ncbi:uncharacterized protein LOC126310605 [Schistocerca gregaria]|uniref:uncharacterized protein LOC126310605 n=1 Tax=Schistocerca gregaria TaxID=7010 RepID=UPI00211F03A9|nr:uncharacterized protein LOC126310605 [Schistocerca gregaria]